MEFSSGCWCGHVRDQSHSLRCSQARDRPWFHSFGSASIGKVIVTFRAEWPLFEDSIVLAILSIRNARPSRTRFHQCLPCITLMLARRGVLFRGHDRGGAYCGGHKATRGKHLYRCTNLQRWSLGIHSVGSPFRVARRGSEDLGRAAILIEEKLSPET